MSKPILPIPGNLFQSSPQQNVSQGNAPGDNSPPQAPGPGKPTYSKRGKITIVACVPCRKRKTKCDGKRPQCTQCTARDGACHYDMSEEQRRLTYLRENVEHLAEEKNTLESLIWNLRNSTDTEAAEILRRLRSGTDPVTLNQHIQAGRSLAQVRRELPGDATDAYHPILLGPDGQGSQYERLVNTIVASSQPEVDEIVRRLRLHEDFESVLNAARNGSLLQPLSDRNVDMALDDEVFGLTRVGARSIASNEIQRGRASDPPDPVQVNRLLTSVTDDQEFTDHLISIYFAWQHSFFQSFPEKLFREGMAAGRRNYCSKMLFNAVCAAGFLLSPRPEDRRDPNDPGIGDIGFFDEAVQHLRETQTSTIPTVAGLFLLCHVEGYRGHLGLVWSYCGQSTRMALDLNLHLRGEKNANDKLTPDAKMEDRARVHVFWGCFIADQVTSFTLGRLPQIPVNAITVDLPPIIKEDDEEPWIAYGINHEPRPGCRSTTFHEVASLSKIVNSTLLMFFAPSQTIKGSLLLNEYEKYQFWYSRLPPLVKKIENAPPHVLCLHIYYHAAVLLLFRPFLKAKFTESDISPRDVCRSAASQISDVFNEHRRLYDTIGIYTFQLHCLLTACTIHIINLPTISSTAYLMAACNHFHDLAPRNNWAASSLSIIKGLVQKWNIILPQEAESALYRRPDDLFTTPGAEDTSYNSSSSQNEVPHPAKRAAFLSPSTEVLQKRQKLQPRGSGGKDNGSKEQPTNYLFAPFPNQPAPLLGPIHTSTSADTAWNDELNKVAQGFDGLKFEGDGWFDPFMGYQGD